MELTTKLTQVDKLLVNLRAQTNNKEGKSYMRVFSTFSETRNKGETTLIRNRKRKQRKRFRIVIESRKQHIKNLSDKQLTDEQISLLSRGLKFIPTPATNEGLIRLNLLKD